VSDDPITLAELAEQSGVPARTIRFYISRGLLDGPVKAGRGAEYNAQHLARLEQIKTLQADGRMLSEIGSMLAEGQRRAAPAPTPWWQHAIGNDVVVWTKADASPWRLKQIRAAIEELAARLAQEEES
jgi:DNA-binding transcriptional MerR regulator